MKKPIKYRLYDENDMYDDIAMTIDRRTSILLQSLFAEYVDTGCSPRAIAQIMCATVNDIMLEHIIDWTK